MIALRTFWDSSVGKKAVMAVTGLILVAFLVGHMIGNLQMFQAPEKINAYSAFLHSLGGALWAVRAVLLASLVLHVVAAVQLTRRRMVARPVGYAHRDPQVSTLASRTIRWGGALLLAFIVFHILHFTVGLPALIPAFDPANVHRNVVIGFQSPVKVLFYVVAMAFVGLHLYHGVWSSARSLGVSPASPRPLARRVALVLAVAVWLGFTVIPLAVAAGLIK